MSETGLTRDWEDLGRAARELGVALDESTLQALMRYLVLLRAWNQRFNLTAIERPSEILIKHFLDSLTCGSVLRLEQHATLIDVGTGAGFPGLVLKLAYPHLRVTLLDAVQKRLSFLEHVVTELRLADVVTVHARAEDAARVGSSLREAFDVATARAVARLNVLAEWVLPFVRVGGAAVLMKGPEIRGELDEAGRAIRLLGGGPPVVRELVLPGADAGRSLVLIPKAGRTPPAYPRRAGAARRDPL